MPVTWDDEEVYLLQELGYLPKSLKMPDDGAPEHERVFFLIKLCAAQDVFRKDHEHDPPQFEWP